MNFSPDKAALQTVLFTGAEILSVLFFLLFAASGIFTKFNVGNGAGMIMCAVIFLLCLKREAVARAAALPAGRLIIISAAALAAICVICAAVISVFMAAAANVPPDEPVPAIVLGCRVKESGPSLMLNNRINAAYEYLTENPNAICIASGGQGTDEPISEAQCIKNALTGMGIDPERIITEDRSRNTFENIRNSLEITDSLGLPRKGVLITSEFHQLRAKMTAKKQGMEVYSKSSSTSPFLLPSYWIREWFGVMYELIIGRK